LMKEAEKENFSRLVVKMRLKQVQPAGAQC